MVSIDSATNLEHLLAPTPFSREKYSSFLYVPYSRKLRRRVYFYTVHGYSLWVRLEVDQDVFKFNERVPKVPISIGNGRATNASPIAISTDKIGNVVVHTFLKGDGERNEEDAEGPKISQWNEWAQARGFMHLAWTRATLYSNPIELDNLKHLLRFVCVAGAFPNSTLDLAVIAALKDVRKITLFKILDQFPQSDRDEVLASIVRLIVDRQIFSDIDRLKFSMITELSAYHAIDKD